MKSLFAALAVVAIIGVGCVGVVRVPGAPVRSDVKADEKCPPGHMWSDGKCHDQGKGHDPAKHSK